MQSTPTPTGVRPQCSLKEYVGLTLRGICMGAADIVPGISGAFIIVTQQK